MAQLVGRGLRALNTQMPFCISGRLRHPAIRMVNQLTIGQRAQTPLTRVAMDGALRCRQTPARREFICGLQLNLYLPWAAVRPQSLVGHQGLALSRLRPTAQQAQQEARRPRLLHTNGRRLSPQAQQERPLIHGQLGHTRPTLRDGLAQSQHRQAQASRFGKHLFP